MFRPDAPYPFLGVVHLLPLPGGPRPSPGFTATRARALDDARSLAENGATGAIVENLGDAPFTAGSVAPHVVAFVAEVGGEIRSRWPSLRLGINLLRNDARSAVGVAAAIGADFVRINVHTGVMVTDQGLLQGEAHQTLTYRRSLGANVHIAADVLVKHAVPLGSPDLGRVAEDTARRGGADALIVTGEGTGAPADPGRCDTVRAAVPEVPVWVGSGVTLASAPMWRERANGAIVGTWLHRAADLAAPLDGARVAAMARALLG